MVRGSVIALACVFATSCGPDNPTKCERQQISPAGVPATPVDVTGVPELLVADEPAVLRVFAPLTSCVSDAPTASVELFDGDNFPVAVDAPQVVNRAGLISAELTFTPSTPGTYFLRATFEPNLGARSTTFLVVGPAALDAGVRISLPMELSSCRDGVWPLSNDAVACESEGVDVFFADGGVQHFDGGALAAAGSVLWSLNLGTLERRVHEGGVLRVTHAVAGFSERPLAAMHGETFAIRRDARGTPTLIRTDGANVDTSTVSEVDGAPFIYDSKRLIQLNANACVAENCEGFSPLAIEPTHVWSWDRIDPRFLRAWPLPFGVVTGVPTLLPGRPVAQERARGPFERLPLWLERSPREPGVDAVLVSFDDGALHMSVWPRSRVLRVGSHVVVLQESDAFTVRLVPR